MPMSWRSALGEYVRILNQIDIEGSAEALRSAVADERYIRMLERRLQRIAGVPGSGRRLSRSETRAKLVHVQELKGRVIALLRLAKKWRYVSGIEQEHVEYERIVMDERRGAWMIVRIEPQPEEKRSLSAFAGRNGSLPEPYLNRALFGPRQPGFARTRYNRDKAKEYADRWWNSANPNFYRFDVDCTNFVSQCLYAGDAPMNYTGRRESGWWYEGYSQGRERWSYSWAVANSLQLYLQTSRFGLRGEPVGSAGKLRIGDIISYDWDGDSRFQHSAIVTAFDPDGEPLVNAHTSDSFRRYWDYRDSYAWSAATRYSFLHIPDVL